MAGTAVSPGLVSSSSQGFRFSSGSRGQGIPERKSAGSQKSFGHAKNSGLLRSVEIQTTGVVARPKAELGKLNILQVRLLRGARG